MLSDRAQARVRPWLELDTLRRNDSESLYRDSHRGRNLARQAVISVLKTKV